MTDVSMLLAATRNPVLSRFTVRQMALLLACYERSPALDTKSASELLGIGKPAVCRACDALEEEGVLARYAVPRDGRKRSIMLTEAGKAYASSLLAGAA